MLPLRATANIMMHKSLQVFLASGLALLLTFGPLLPQASARTKKGDKLLKQAQAAEARELWDEAADLYSQAVDEDPADVSYRIGMRRARFQASQGHIQRARDLRSKGNIPEALAALNQAIVLDPSSAIALQELKATQEMLLNPAGSNKANLTPYEQAQQEAADRSASLLSIPELVPPRTPDGKAPRIQPMRMNNQPIRVLYNTIAAIAGISVVIDPSWNGQVGGKTNFDIDIPAEMSVEQAFDYVATVTRTFWKPVSPTTIFVTEDSQTKRRDFTDQVTKTFFVTNAATAQEFNEIMTSIRTITDIRRVFGYAAMKAIVVRGDVDAVNLAEKLVRDLDKPKSEVVIDIVIMEANSSRTRDWAATIQSLGQAGLTLPVTFTPRPGIANTGTGTNVVSTVPLNNLGRLSSADWSTSLPGALLQAILSDSRTKILNQPQVRASEGQKARLEIGDRIPIASGSFQTGVTGATGVGVNTTFQFQPVGVIVDITPQQVHSSSEVTLHIELEISQVKEYVDVGNIKQPVVGQNKSTADIRMREGEISILAGLTRNQATDVVSGLPGVIDIPVLGKWLGSNRQERDRGDLMIALIPHIVRTPNFTSENLRGVFAGTDAQLRLMYNPREAAGSAPVELTPAAPAGAPPATEPKPAPATPGAPAGGQARVAFTPATVAATANSPFTLNVQLENVADAATVSPIRVSWDPALLRLNDIAPGELMARDGGRVTSVKDIRNDAGQASLILSRAAGSPGVNGTGAVATLTFVALAPGNARVTVTEVGLRDTQNRPTEVSLGAIPVAIQ